MESLSDRKRISETNTDWLYVLLGAYLKESSKKMTSPRDRIASDGFRNETTEQSCRSSCRTRFSSGTFSTRRKEKCRCIFR